MSDSVQSVTYLPFGLGCECGECVIVPADQRCQPVSCKVCGRIHGPFGDAPTLDWLPESNASLRDLIRFADSYNPAPHFQMKWGADYQSNVSSLWQRFVQEYKRGSIATGPTDELLMCLAYDVVLGAHLGVPEPHKVAFLQWLIDGLRRSMVQ